MSFAEPRRGFIARTVPLARGPWRRKPSRVSRILRPEVFVPPVVGPVVVLGHLHMARVAGLGCLVCEALGHDDVAAEVHHVDILTLKAMGPRESDFLTAPLCPCHHQGKGQAHGLANHAHQGDERWFWMMNGLDIGRWVLELLGRWYGGECEEVNRVVERVEEKALRWDVGS